MKKLFCSFLAIILTLSVFFSVPFSNSSFKITAEAAATSGSCGDNATWSLKNGTLTISGTGAMKNYTDSKQQPWRGSVSAIKKVVIKNGITDIGSFAFHTCTSLTTVELPESLRNVFAKAFYNCYNLTTIAFPAKLLSVGDSAFMDCDKLTSVVLPDALARIGKDTFKKCDNLAYVAIGKQIKSIGESAFNNCNKLENIFYAGSSVEWKQVSVGKYNPCFSKKFHYNVPNELMNCHYGYGQVVTENNVKKNIYTCPCGYKKDGGRTSCSGHKYTNQTTIRQPNCTDYGAVKKVCEYCGDIVYVSNFSWFIKPNPPTKPYPASTHPYSHNTNQTYTFYHTGAEKLVITFSQQTYTESGFDFIYIYTASGALYGKYSGNELAGAVIHLQGDHFTIKITSDGSNNGYGFSLDRINAYHTTTNLNPQTNAHTYSSLWTVDTVSTCAKNGSKSHHCIRCSAKKNVTSLKKKAHKYGDWSYFIGPDGNPVKSTYTSMGQMVKKCTECSDVFATVVPAIPKPSTVSNTSSGITFTWEAAKGATGYIIYRKTTSGKWTSIGTVGASTTSYTDKTAQSGVSYKYTAKAKGSEELSSPYDENGIALRRLVTPTLSSATSTKNGVSLKWTTVKGATGYMVYRKTGSGSYSKIVTQKGASKLTYVDKTAKKGSKYTYKVIAYYTSSSKTSYSAYSSTKTLTDKY